MPAPLIPPSFWVAFAVSGVACAFNALGILAVTRMEHWAQRQVPYFISFAAGILITVSFLHLIPQAFALSGNGAAPGWLLGGFFGLYLVNQFVVHAVCATPVCDEDVPEEQLDKVIHHHHHDGQPGFGVAPAIGIGLHSFIDGIIYAVAFSVDTFTGLITILGLLLHEFPEGIITYLMLLHGGMAKPRARKLAILAAGFTTPLGFLLAYPFVSRIDDAALGLLLALAAGALIYVGGSHLLPKTEQYRKPYRLLAVAGGILVAILVVLSDSH